MSKWVNIFALVEDTQPIPVRAVTSEQYDGTDISVQLRLLPYTACGELRNFQVSTVREDSGNEFESLTRSFLSIGRFVLILIFQSLATLAASLA